MLSEAIPPSNNKEPLLMPLTSWDLFTPGDLLLCFKGALEIFLVCCSHVISSSSDQPLFLTYATCQCIIVIQEQWTAQSCHVLLAHHVVPGDDLPVFRKI